MARVSVEATLTLEQLLSTVREAEDAEAEGALTVQELVRSTGHNEKWVRARLLQLKEAGRVEIVKVLRTRLDDQPFTTVAYRLVGGSFESYST